MQSGIKLISRIYLKLVLLQVAVGTLLRIVLLFNEQTSDISFTFGQWLKIFLLGAVNDWCALTIGFAVLWLFALSIAPGKYARPLGYILFGILSVAWIYVTFFNTIFDEYGSVVPLIASILFGFWAVSFGLRLFLPQIRPGWRRTWLAVLTGLYTGGIILNAVSEWFFWSEFGVRYNFIAVDYLVYTNEVVGNIMESYPVVPLFAGVLLLTVGCTWLLFRREIRRAGEFGTWQWKAAVSPAYLLLTLGCCLLLQFNTRFQQSANTYANELQATGAYKFYDAFMKNELSYPQFYLTLPQKEAEANVHAIYGSTGDNLRHIPGNPDTLRRNIVLITIESMSASFMQHFGYPDAITPHLDSLYKMGIAFEQCFATGNRTVRGLEAVTLSLPPCPGQSIIKRPR
ncbi:LTA synthase family protein, partial [Alistipes putredinis]